jgi:hypothetical protein
MSAFAFFLLMMLLAKQGGGGGGLLSPSSPAKTLPIEAAKAQQEALAKTHKAQTTGHPVHAAEAKAAQTKAAVLTQAARTAVTAAKSPPAWPQAVPAKGPNGLPPFPAGWVPDQPPPQAVQTRAWQLLPVLWKQGANARKTEQTNGRWITYVAQAMGSKKGVVAYKVRPGAMPTAPTPTGPQANA